MSDSQTKQIPYIAIIIASLLGNLIWVQRWWGHTSTGGSVLGAYSLGYFAFLVLTIVAILAWGVLLIGHKRILQWTAKPSIQRIVVIVLIVSAIAMLFLSTRGFRWQITEFFGMNWGLFTIVLLYPYEDTPQHQRYWLTFILITMIAIAICIVLMSIIGRPYSPDEAIWADIAASFRREGTLTYSLANNPSHTILPGIGWINLLHAEIQWLFDFDVRVSRVFQLVIHGFGILGLGLLSNRLYGKWAGLSVIVMAIAGSAFLNAFDYRADHFLILPQAFAFFCAVSAWKSTSFRQRIVWNLLAGLIITLSLQFHAAGLGYAIGMSLFYLVEFIISWIREKQISRASIETLVAYGIGAGLGTVIYYVANILSVGGLEVYLNALVSDRFSNTRSIRYVFFKSQLDTVLLWGSLLFLLWRHNSDDRRYLTLLILTMLGIFLVDTQGYVYPYLALFLVPMSALISGGFPKRQTWVIAVIAVALLPQTFQWISWQAVSNVITTGSIPPHAIELAGREILDRVPLDEDTIIVGTHELIWVMPDNLNLHAIASEGAMPKHMDITPLGVWELLQPEIYIEMRNRAITPSGLSAYLIQEGFQICQEFSPYGIEIIIHRVECPIENSE